MVASLVFPRDRFEKKILFPWAVLVVLFFQGPAPAAEYFSLDGYVDAHPKQKQITQAFSNRVRAKGIPLEKGAQKRPVAISFIYPGEQVSDYWRRSILSFKRRMDEIQIKYMIKECFTKPVVDYRIQEKQIRQALSDDPDYLVFTLDINKHRRIIERIITKQRPKLILQNITTPLKTWEGKQPFLYVGFDHERGARMIAEHFMEKTGGQGRYALLYFSQGHVSRMRGDTFIDFLKAHSRLELVSSYYTDGNRARSRQAATEILNEFPGIRFIYACSTDVALGAMDALTANNKSGDILLNGWGGGSSELEAIEAKRMDATVMRMNDDNGVAMAEAVRLDIEGKKKEVPTVFSGSFVLIQKGIPKNELDRHKKWAFRYSGH